MHRGATWTEEDASQTLIAVVTDARCNKQWQVSEELAVMVLHFEWEYYAHSVVGVKKGFFRDA